MREKCHLKIFFNINAYEAGFCGTGNKHTYFLIKKKSPQIEPRMAVE